MSTGPRRVRLRAPASARASGIAGDAAIGPAPSNARHRPRAANNGHEVHGTRSRLEIDGSPMDEQAVDPASPILPWDGTPCRSLSIPGARARSAGEDACESRPAVPGEVGELLEKRRLLPPESGPDRLEIRNSESCMIALCKDDVHRTLAMMETQLGPWAQPADVSIFSSVNHVEGPSRVLDISALVLRRSISMTASETLASEYGSGFGDDRRVCAVSRHSGARPTRYSRRFRHTAPGAVRFVLAQPLT